MLRAITREVSPAIVNCELEFLDRQPIDLALAIEQHRQYQAALAELGVHVEVLPSGPDMPDGVFVEDPAIVLDEIAVMTRMGALSRRGEGETLARALAKYRELRHIVEPGTLEGGDVMRIGKTLYVGYSRRTNVAGIQQLATMLHPLGYFVVPVEVQGCLHLKSACCYVGDDTVLANRAWMDPDAFCSLEDSGRAGASGRECIADRRYGSDARGVPANLRIAGAFGFPRAPDRQLGAAEGRGGRHVHQPDL